VNLPATKERFLSTGRKIASYARVKDLNAETFRAFLDGRQPPSSGAVSARIIAVLREDGLLVEEEDEEDTTKAA